MRKHPLIILRSERNLSRLEMARQIYDATGQMVYHRTVQQWERGVNNPTFSNLARIAATFGRTVALDVADWHLEREENDRGLGRECEEAPPAS